MKFLSFIFIVTLILMSFVLTDSKALPKDDLSFDDNFRRVKHERIQAAGGKIGFVKTKFHKD